MFSKKSNSDKAPHLRAVDGGRPKGKGISMLAEGCSFQGKMFLQGESRVGGRVEGTVISDGMLTVEESAIIVGDLHGVTVQLNGQVDGNLRASEVIRLSATARVRGDLCAKRLIVEDGARIEGRVSSLVVTEQVSAEDSSKTKKNAG